MASPGGGVKLSKKGLYFIDADKVRRRAVAYGRAGENMVELMGQRLLVYDRKMKVAVEENFKQRIGFTRPNTREVSRALGGPGYGIERGRQSGRFVGPTAHAFRGTRRGDPKSKRQVIGFPDVEFADRTTRGVWRQLEFGAPTGYSSRPPGLFLQAGSQTTSSAHQTGRRQFPLAEREGFGPQFAPTSRNAGIPNPAQPAWFFIRDAFETVSQQELPKFKRLPVSAFSKLR